MADGMRLTTLLPVGAATLAAAALGLAAPASADVVTVQPGAGDPRTFAVSAGGWTAGHAGFCTTPRRLRFPGVRARPGRRHGRRGRRLPAHGRQRPAGARRGLDLALARLPGARDTDTATLSVALRTDASALLGLGAADLDLIVRDETAGTDTVVDDDVPLSGAGTAGWRVRQPSVPSAALAPGHDLRIVVRLQIAAPLAVLPPTRVDVDDVALTMVDAAVPATGDPTPTDPTGPSIGGEAVDGGNSGSDAAPVPLPAAPITPSLSAMLRACFGGDLALTAVVPQGRRVHLRGLSALPAGTRVVLSDERGRTVARARVARGGRFAATATAPATARRARTRYTAVAGRVRSRALALVRATTVDALTAKGSTVTVKGRVDLRRIGRRPGFVLTGGRGPAACGPGAARLAVKGRVAFNRRTGAYTLRVAVPAGTGPAVVRAAVRGKIRSASLFGLL